MFDSNTIKIYVLRELNTANEQQQFRVVWVVTRIIYE